MSLVFHSCLYVFFTFCSLDFVDDILSRWWFQLFLCSPLPGEIIQFDSYFRNGLKPPT